MKKLIKPVGFLYMLVYIVFSFGLARAGTLNLDKFYSLDGFFSDSWDLSKYEEFVPSKGDYFLVDVDDGLGYLVNDEKKVYIVFPLMTGGLRTPTPRREWYIKEENIQSNRIVFGKTGEFLRMYSDDGKTRTSYGIHGYAYFDEEIAKGTKYLSLGCVIVSDHIHDLLEESFLANGKNMYMLTTDDVNLSSYISIGRVLYSKSS